jgi:hypothetical protein
MAGPMSGAGFKSLYGRKGYRPQSVLKRSIGEVKAGKAISSGSFNNFPAIIAAFPDICDDIVIETTEELAILALGKAPVGPTGELSIEHKIKHRRTPKGSNGRIDFTAKSEGDHLYPWYVEVGTTDTAAQPFVVPAVVEMRTRFHGRLREIESRLPG